MLDRPLRGTEAIANRAQHAIGGEIREAHELYPLGYDDDDKWVCPDENCRARMTPCAWKPLNRDGEPYQRSPYFRAEPAHSPVCVAWRSDARQRSTPESTVGYAADYPNRVVLSPAPPWGGDMPITNEFDGSEPCGTVVRETHASWTRSIRKACEFYVASVEHHQRSLRVDGCVGATYSECFVRLGTGARKIVGRQWIFYDQIWLKDWIDLDVEPLVIQLMNTVSGVHRTLTIYTTDWPENHRRDLRRRFRTALREGKAAYRQGEKDCRSWIFFVGREELYDQTGFQADLQPGVEVLVCNTPKQGWSFRPSARFMRATGRFYVQEAATEPPLSAKTEFVVAPQEDDAAAPAMPTMANHSEQEISTGLPVHNRKDCESADKQLEARLCTSTKLRREEAEEQPIELSELKTEINAAFMHAHHEHEEAKNPEHVEVEPTLDNSTYPDHGAQDGGSNVIVTPSKEVGTMWVRIRKTVLRLVRRGK